MNDYIGIIGVLSGIKGILKFKENDTPELLRVRIENAIAMLEGVIKELTPEVTVNPNTTSSPMPDTTSLDPEARKAKAELL